MEFAKVSADQDHRYGAVVGSFPYIKRWNLLYLFAGFESFSQLPCLDSRGELDPSIRYVLPYFLLL